MLEAKKTRVQALADELRDAVQEVNTQRKDAQLKAGTQLREDSTAWYQLVQKNQQIEAACLVLEREIAIARAAQHEHTEAHPNGSTVSPTTTTGGSDAATDSGSSASADVEMMDA
jgi:Breast carcinoma amplified sequence 2 (BCAS2)